jgi:hypothetical protein
MVRRNSERGRSGSRRRPQQRSPTPGRQGGQSNRSEEARIDKMAKAALQELVRLQKQTASRSAPKWACNCGYKTNFADRSSCYRCAAKKGEGKGPAPLQPSQHVNRPKPALTPTPASSTPGPPEAAQPQSCPEVDLEACRRSAVDRLRHLRLLQDQSPGDPTFARWVTETEAELSIVKGKLHALKTPAARLQACLTRKTAADKEVTSAQAAASAAAAVLDLANGRLTAAADAQTALEHELRDLRLDGLLGTGATLPTAAPDPINLLEFAKAILAAVAPSATITAEALEQMAVRCNLAPPPAPPAVPAGPTERPPAGSATPHASQVRARSPSATVAAAQEAPAVRVARQALDAAVAVEAARAQEEAVAAAALAATLLAAGGGTPMEVTDSAATAPHTPRLVPPRK